jgi:hypothetical protein
MGNQTILLITRSNTIWTPLVSKLYYADSPYFDYFYNRKEPVEP